MAMEKTVSKRPRAGFGLDRAGRFTLCTKQDFGGFPAMTMTRHFVLARALRGMSVVVCGVSEAP